MNQFVFFLESPNSFTGEDVVEIHTHGDMIAKNIIDILVNHGVYWLSQESFPSDHI